MGGSSSKQRDLANLRNEPIPRGSDDSLERFGDRIADREEETRLSNLGLQYLEKPTDGLRSISVVLQVIWTHLANTKTAMPNKEERTTEEKRLEHLETTTGILQREVNGLLKKAGPASKMTDHSRHNCFHIANQEVALWHNATFLQTVQPCEKDSTHYGKALSAQESRKVRHSLLKPSPFN